MRVGIFGGDVVGGASFDDLVADVRASADAGFSTYWLPQIFGYDALTALAAIGREVRGIELGTSVVPTYARHPMMMAGQALTVQALTGGRLALGIGLSHKIVVESLWGLSYDKPLRHMREYLAVLRPLIHGEAVSFQGETIQTVGQVLVPGSSPCPILLAALGPKMLELAGTMGEGTITWMTGPKTIESHVAPTINTAAAAAGKPPPRVVAGVPVVVTDNPDAAKAQAGEQLATYNFLPSYRAMLDREGAAGPADVVVAGDEATVTAELQRYAYAGTTDLAAVAAFGTPDERARTRAVLLALQSAAS